VIGSGGASDGNYTVFMGTATIDSMGLVEEGSYRR